MPERTRPGSHGVENSVVARWGRKRSSRRCSRCRSTWTSAPRDAIPKAPFPKNRNRRGADPSESDDAGARRPPPGLLPSTRTTRGRRRGSGRPAGCASSEPRRYTIVDVSALGLGLACPDGRRTCIIAKHDVRPEPRSGSHTTSGGSVSCATGLRDPNDAKLEPDCRLPNRLGGATEDGGVKCGSAGTALPLPSP
jgi:hypothetical protein